MPLTDEGAILASTELPTLCSVYMLDAVVSKVHVALEDMFNQAVSEPSPARIMDVSQDLVPATFLLVKAYTVFCR